jgi:hypothetical protein
MKLFHLRLTTLKSKLYAIVFASFVVRVVAFFVLPNTASNLAPDEGTYATLTEWISAGKEADTFYSDTLYLRSRSFVIPASLLHKVGISAIDSVRIVASIYGLLTFTLIALVLLRIIGSKQETANLLFKNQKSVLILFTVFGLLPSHFIWSVLGLREAALEFWVLIVFFLVFYVFGVKKSPSKLAFLGILIAIPLVFSARPQVGWVLGVTLLIYCLLRVRTKAAQILLPLTIVGVVSGYVFTTEFSIETTETFTARAELDNRALLTIQAEMRAGMLCKFEGQELGIGEAKFICSKEVREREIVGLKNPGVALFNEATEIPDRQLGNTRGAESKIKILSCPNAGTSQFDKLFCISYRAPYTSYTFLFRPILGVDVTSSSSLFAALENVFWLGAALFIGVMFIRNRRLAFFGALAPSLLFFTIFTIGAGAYEGNMGTAFRHKSLILWVIILLLASTIIATQERKAEQQENSGSSQE